MNSFVIIPARIDSLRLPKKMALNETGKPLIQHTYENLLPLKGTSGITDIYVATPDREIINICEGNGINYITPKAPAKCGSHCCMLAAYWNDLPKGNLINVQGDCPNVELGAVRAVAEHVSFNFECCSLYYESLDEDLANDPSSVKMVTNANDDIIYYSRCPVPFDASLWKIHIGVYGFPYNIWRSLLDLYGKDDKPRNSYHSYNISENLEQLFWLEKGFKSHCIKSGKATYSIDTRKDYDEFKRDCFSGKRGVGAVV